MKNKQIISYLVFILLLLTCVNSSFLVTNISAADTSWKSPGTIADDSSNGETITWQNPSNADTQDDVDAQIEYSSTANSHYLKCTNFGFTTTDVPAGSTIDGITVEVDASANRDDIDACHDYQVYLVKGGTIQTSGDNKANLLRYEHPDVDNYRSYGGSSDLWSVSLSASDVISSGFGVAISSALTGRQTGFIDHVRIKITYTAPPSNNNPINSVPVPSDTADAIQLNTNLSVTVTDADGDTMNQTFRTNASGGWMDIAWNNNTGNATLENTTTVFTNYGTKYWWSSNLSDDNGGWDNDTYSFTTQIYHNNLSWYFPTSCAGGWQSATNAYLNDTLNAGGIKSWERYSDFEISGNDIINDIPTNVTITGIRVGVEIKGFDGTGGTLKVKLSNDSGMTNTSEQTVDYLYNVQQYAILGGTQDLWGRGSWNRSEFSAANFYLFAYCDDDRAFVDFFNISVSYTEVYCPVVTNPSPAHCSVVSKTTNEFSATIERQTGETFNWTIECSNGQSNSGNNENNGTKTCTLSGLTDGKKYTVLVNVTPDSSNQSKTYYFYTTPTITVDPVQSTIVFTGDNTDKNVNATGQSSGTHALSITNTGTEDLILDIKLNNTVDNVHLIWSEAFSLPGYDVVGNYDNWAQYRKNDSNTPISNGTTIPIPSDVYMVIANSTGTYDMWGNPALVDGILYITGKRYNVGYESTNKTKAYYIQNGTMLWESVDGMSSDDSTVYYDPPDSEPCIYVQNERWWNTTSNLVCMWASNGTIKWSKETAAGGSWDMSGSPEVDSDHNIIYATASSAVWALNASTGSQIWQNNYGSDFQGAAIYESDYVYYSTSDDAADKGVYCVNYIDGSESWKHVNENKYVTWDAGVALDDTYVYLASSDTTLKYLTKFNKASGNIVQQNTSMPKQAMGITAYGDYVYVTYATATKSLYCFDKATLTEQWSSDSTGAAYSHPTLADGYLYYTTTSGGLYCLYANNGTEYWRDVEMSSYAQVMISKGLLIFYRDDWNTYILGNVTEYKENAVYFDNEVINDFTREEWGESFSVTIGASASSNLYLWSQYDGANIPSAGIDRLINISYMINGTSTPFYTSQNIRFSKGETTPPSITINFAGNLSDSGGPYYRPPGESTQLTGVWSDGYYTNDSMQSEDWIYINLTVGDASGVSTVYLQWKNGSTWTNNTYEFTNRSGGWFDINTSGTIQTCEGYDYSFDVRAIDPSNNEKTIGWNKTGLGGSATRRYVQLNCTPEDITFRPYYFHKAAYSDTTKKDRLHHDQGQDGSSDDTSYMTSIIPSDTVGQVWCAGFAVYWFDDTVCADSFNLDNIYFHTWMAHDWSNPITMMGYLKNREQASVSFQSGDYVSGIVDNRSVIYYDNGLGNWDNNYSLHTFLVDVGNTPFTDNDIYELSVGGVAANISFISNRSFTSFILFNVPSNASLNASGDSDTDGLSDWTELYVTYTNPFLDDTDNDGVDDNIEQLTGSDPNNYTDTDSEYLWIDVTNSSWNLGSVLMGSSIFTNETGITFIADMDNTTVNTDLKLQITNDGAQWSAATAGNEAGINTYRLNASIDVWSTENQIVTASTTTISSNVIAGQDESFDLRFDAPTSSTTGVLQTITTTATLVKH